MNKSLLILIFFISLSCRNNTNKTTENILTIEGRIEGLNDSTLIVLSKGKEKIDSTYSINNSFNLFVKEQENDLSYFIELKRRNDSLIDRVEFWLDKDVIMIVGSVDKKNITVIDSKLNNQIKKYRNIPNKYNNKIDELFKSSMSAQEKQKNFTKYLDTIKSEQKDFLFLNPNNSFSLSNLFLYKNETSKDSLILFYNRIDNKLQESKNGVILKEYISSNKIRIGEQFIDFEAIDIEGNMIKLSDFKGKILLLDFWAIWCTWCHVQNKNEFSYLQKKYKDKLVIISYSLDTQKSDWEKSSKIDSLFWVDISNLKGIKDPVAFQYGVSILPNSFLINQKGIVVKQFVGYDKNNIIEKEIKKLLN